MSAVSGHHRAVLDFTGAVLDVHGAVLDVHGAVLDVHGAVLLDFRAADFGHNCSVRMYQYDGRLEHGTEQLVGSGRLGHRPENREHSRNVDGVHLGHVPPIAGFCRLSLTTPNASPEQSDTRDDVLSCPSSGSTTYVTGNRVGWRRELHADHRIQDHAARRCCGSGR